MSEWSTACLDWKRRLRERRSLIPFKPLFPATADAKMAVFTSLQIVDLGTNLKTGRYWTIGETADEWLLDFAAAVFGAYDADRGQQLIREFMLLISKKNTKSTAAAGIMLTELITGWRPQDENLILAPTKEVANNSFVPATSMVREDEELNALLHVQDHLRLITNRSNKATMKVVAADSGTVAGKKGSRVIVDELWLFGEMSNADAMLQEATGGQVSRPEGYTLYLTTQSDKPPAGVFKDKLAYFRDVRDGKIADRRKLPVLYELPPEMIEAEEHLDPANFYMTNPNLGRSVSQEWLEEKFAEVAHAEDGTKQIFYAKHLNVEIGLRLARDFWPGATYWEGAKDPELAQLDAKAALAALLGRCDVAVVGIDGGGLDDLLGLAVLGRCKTTRDWLLWNHAWAHTDVFERRKDIVSRLEDFRSAGQLTLCEDPTADIMGVADIVEQVKETGLLPEKKGVGIDPAGATMLVDEMAARGIELHDHGGPVTGITQGWRLSPAVWGLERKLKDGTFWHAGQALMSWCVGNAKVEQRSNAVVITKQTAGKAKIDPLIATLNAVMLMQLNPEGEVDGVANFLAAMRAR